MFVREKTGERTRSFTFVLPEKCMKFMKTGYLQIEMSEMSMTTIHLSSHTTCTVLR